MVVCNCHVFWIAIENPTNRYSLKEFVYRSPEEIPCHFLKYPILTYLVEPVHKIDPNCLHWRINQRKGQINRNIKIVIWTCVARFSCNLQPIQNPIISRNKKSNPQKHDKTENCYRLAATNIFNVKAIDTFSVFIVKFLHNNVFLDINFSLNKKSLFLFMLNIIHLERYGLESNICQFI